MTYGVHDGFRYVGWGKIGQNERRISIVKDNFVFQGQFCLPLTYGRPNTCQRIQILIYLINISAVGERVPHGVSARVPRPGVLLDEGVLAVGGHQASLLQADAL